MSPPRGVKTPPQRGPKRVIFGVRGSGGPRSRVWDPRFGVWEALFGHFWTSKLGRPSRAAPQLQTAHSLWILEGSRPPKRVDFGSFLGPFWPFLDLEIGTTLRGPSLTPNSPLAMDFGGLTTLKKGRFWVIFGPFLAIFDEAP